MVNISRAKALFKCTHTDTFTRMHINHLSLCYVLMRQEHEGCMCIANVIPSHQMAWVFSFFAITLFYLFPHLLSSSPSFLLLLFSVPLVLFLSYCSIHHIFFFFFSTSDLIFLVHFICGFTSSSHSSMSFFSTHFSVGLLSIPLPLSPPSWDLK